MDTVTFNVEYTDTFGGEANYCWVRRADIEVPHNASQALIMRRAKAAMGITGARGRTDSHGDMFEFRPYGCCTILFVNFDYS
jgi:hypothetical protein